MKILRNSGPAILLAIGFVSLIVLSSLRDPPKQKIPESTTALVSTDLVRSCESGFTIQVDGEVVPFRELNLAAQVGGRISAKSARARAGNYVRAGDPLFEIDSRDYELEVRRLQETVNQAGTNIEELDVEQANLERLITLAKETLELSRRESKRLEGLRVRNAASLSQLENSRQAELQSLNSLQTLENQVSLLQTRRNRLIQEKERALTNLELAQLNLERTKIASTTNGVVIEDFAEQDDYVQVGTRIIRIEDTSKVEVRFSLRLDQLQWLWQSSDTTAQKAPPKYTYKLPPVPVDIKVELDGSQFSWQARLDRYDGAGISSATRTVPVIAVVDDPNDVRISSVVEGAVNPVSPPTLLRGAFVSVSIPVGAGMNLASIPAISLQPDSTVWIFENQKLRIRHVKVAYSSENSIIVMAQPGSIEPGDQIVTTPLPVATDGMDLELHKEESTEVARTPSSSPDVSDG